MSADTDFVHFSCFMDLLGYQKNEIVDSVCKLVNVQSPLLEETMFLCSFPLPPDNYAFKMFLRQFGKNSLQLGKFTLEIGTDYTVIRCQVVYDTCNMVSRPLFCFSNRQFKNAEMLQKQLESLKFTYKISRSHLFFQVMQFNGDASAIQFHYNATKDCFASSPTGMNYYTFVSRNKDKITTIKNNHLVPLQSTTPEQPWPASDQSWMLSKPPPDPVVQSSVAQTTHETFDNFIDTPRQPLRSVRRDLYSDAEDPDFQSRLPASSGVSTRLANMRIRQAQSNRKIITEIAQAKGTVCNSDMIEEMFTSKTQWNITKYGLLSMALHGVIPLVDQRLSLSEEESEQDKEDTTDVNISDLTQEKDKD